MESARQRPVVFGPRNLSPAHLRIIEGIWQGKLYKQIADDWGTTEATVKTYACEIRKLFGGVTNIRLALWWERARAH